MIHVQLLASPYDDINHFKRFCSLSMQRGATVYLLFAWPVECNSPWGGVALAPILGVHGAYLVLRLKRLLELHTCGTFPF